MSVSQSRNTKRPAQVAAKMGIGLSSFWLKVKNDPDFPKLFKLGPRTTVVFDDEIDAYLERCAAKSRSSDETVAPKAGCAP